MDEENGVKAIIFLQAMVGIVETEEEARLGWKSMSNWEKDATMRVYESMKGNS